LLQETIVMTDTIWPHWIRNSRNFLFLPTTELFPACLNCIPLCSNVRKREVLGFTNVWLSATQCDKGCTGLMSACVFVCRCICL